MEQTVAILILFYNKLEQTTECINSFLPSGNSIYVLNNGSDENQWQVLQKTYRNNGQVVLLDAGSNLGPAGGRNLLIQQTKEEWLLFIDSDITIKPVYEWLTIFKKYITENPSVSIVCPKIFNVHEHAYMERLRLVKEGNVLSIENGEFQTSNFFPEGGAFVKRSIFTSYGLYDEKMFAFEGYEFSLRAMMSDYGELKAYYISNIELIHDHRFQKSNRDKIAVKQRYDEERLKSSYDHMVSKLGIVFEHNWQWWSNKQVKDMTIHPLVSRFKSLISRIIKRAS